MSSAVRHLGQYELLELLGEGAMGAVWLGRDPRFDRPVAVKVVHPHLLRDESLVERFKTEAVIQAKLSHPHIVAVYDFVASPEALAMVLEYVDGPDLGRLLTEAGGVLPVDLAVGLLGQALSAVGFAHTRGLVHRDLKPENILVHRAGEEMIAKVADFGIAKVLGSEKLKTATSTKMGTLAYMSPEHVRSPKSVDARSDIYSLGVTLFELLTGRRPFDADTEYGLMSAIVECPAPSVSELLGGVAGEFDDVVRQALEKDPAQRFQTCEEFRRALRQAAGFAGTYGSAPVLSGSEGQSPIPRPAVIPSRPPERPDWAREAEMLLAEGRADEAAKRLREVVERDRWNAEAAALLATAETARAAAREAAEAARRAEVARAERAAAERAAAERATADRLRLQEEEARRAAEERAELERRLEVERRLEEARQATETRRLEQERQRVAAERAAEERRAAEARRFEEERRKAEERSHAHREARREIAGLIEEGDLERATQALNAAAERFGELDGGDLLRLQLANALEDARREEDLARRRAEAEQQAREHREAVRNVTRWLESGDLERASCDLEEACRRLGEFDGIDLLRLQLANALEEERRADERARDLMVEDLLATVRELVDGGRLAEAISVLAQAGRIAPSHPSVAEVGGWLEGLLSGGEAPQDPEVLAAAEQIEGLLAAGRTAAAHQAIEFAEALYGQRPELAEVRRRLESCEEAPPGCEAQSPA